MKQKEIHRTSTFSWSPSASLPLLATGTVAGALDESFSNESQLEIWAPDFLDREEYELGGEGQHGPKGVVTDTARFNRLAWGFYDQSRPRGVIAAGMENGELALWDPAKILSGANVDSLILRNTTHTGPVRGLDFNPIQSNLLASGGVNGEVYIWDLKDPSKPYTPTPGARSTKLDEITSVAWNQQVQYVLAGASSTGYTVVWDLRGKREVVALAYGGGAGTLAGQVGAGSGMAVGGRRGMSDIAWHPDNATRVVTASEDDSSPIIMVWDLRNARAPEKILTGHEKGVLSLSWCKQDADLLLSCGKDNRALCWNPQTSEIIGELPSADNWAFQVEWCPRNPDLLATAFFDGTIGIHSIQSTNDAPGTSKFATPQADGADIFDTSSTRSIQSGTLSLKQPPKWLRRPVSSSFGFGGKLITVSNLPSAQGKNQSSSVNIRQVVTEPSLIERATKLQLAMKDKALEPFTEETIKSISSTAAKDGWKALLSLFKANSRDELVTLLNFSKEEIAARVAEAVENLKKSTGTPKFAEDDAAIGKTHEPVVSFAEPERQEVPQEDSDSGEDATHEVSSLEQTPSEVSAGVTSDTTSLIPLGDGESTTTAPSLFGDELGPGTPQHDFFSTVGIAQADGESRTVHVPHTNYGLDSSVAATIGSGPSSVTSEIMRSNSFKIYPADESETDKLITKAIVLGDFESAVSLCLSSNRFADAILLAVQGGQELLQRTQRAYFDRRTSQRPYLRLLQSVVTNDLTDIVQNADLNEWHEIFVVLCTFAKPDEFHGLAEQLGDRLEFKSSLLKSTEDGDAISRANAYRKNATLTYLASNRLEKLVSIWTDELREEENDLLSKDNTVGSYYSAHARALQTFIEKVTVFRSATDYKDEDLSSNVDVQSGKAYKLANLYDRYYEYADILSAQGLVEEAVVFIKLAPSAYSGSNDAGLSSERDRLLATIKQTPAAKVASQAAVPAVPTSTANKTGYSGYQNYNTSIQQQPIAPYNQPATSERGHYGYVPPAPAAIASNAYVPSHSTVSQPSAPTSYPQNIYNPQNTNTLTQPPHLRQQQHPTTAVPPPPRGANGTPGVNPTPPPPPKRQEVGGWNDAPVLSTNRGPAGANASKLAAITSPFPNAASSPTYSPTGSPLVGQGQATLPPPPRPGSVQARPQPPPPPQTQRIQGTPQPGGGSYPGQARPPSRPNVPPQFAPPPARMMSPAQPQPPSRQPTPPQYAPPQGVNPGQNLPPQQFARQSQPPPSGPYGVPQPGQQHHPGLQGPGPAPSMQTPQMQHPGPYGPPQGQQRPGPSHPPAGSPQPGGGPPRTSAISRAPPQPKYPPGDRSHIPETVLPAYHVILDHLNRMKQTTPPQQKRIVDDLERRINPLFDALNCSTLSDRIVEQLLVLTRAMEAQDRPAALAIHVDLLTQGLQGEDIGLWMSGIKQLIMRM